MVCHYKLAGWQWRTQDQGDECGSYGAQWVTPITIYPPPLHPLTLVSVPWLFYNIQVDQFLLLLEFDTVETILKKMKGVP